jgi:hypothetical protein
LPAVKKAGGKLRPVDRDDPQNPHIAGRLCRETNLAGVNRLCRLRILARRCIVYRGPAGFGGMVCVSTSPGKRQ